MAVAGDWLVFSSMGMAMRALVLAMIVIQVGLGHAAYAENSQPSARSISEALPLFDKNRCTEVKDPADRIFCGDPELNDAAPRLSSAIEGRLNRLSDRRLAIEENAEWIKNRNASCGIFGNEAVTDRDIDSVRKCLLKETEERIALLTNPNFDCCAGCVRPRAVRRTGFVRLFRCRIVERHKVAGICGRPFTAPKYLGFMVRIRS